VQWHTETLSSLLGKLMTLSRIEARDDRGEALAEIEAPISAEDLNLLVDNLLDNALKYTLEEGKATLEVANVAFDIVLRVSDSGIGFDDEAADRLFEHFYRTGATEGGLDFPS